jgi:hypothetical protein
VTTPAGDDLDIPSLFGLRVRSRAGRPLGVIVAVIHRGDGCDVLIERRHWWRRAVTRLDVDDLVAGELGVLQQVPAAWRRNSAAGGSGDNAVA